VRRLPLLFTGVLMLPLGVLPAASAVAAGTEPAPPAAEAPADPAPQDPAPGDEAPEDPAPEDPAEDPAPEDPAPGDPEDPELPGIPDVTGEFTRSPASGPAGTKVDVRSRTKCVADGGDVGSTVEVVMIARDDLDSPDEPEIVDLVLDTRKDGSWRTKLTVPSSAEPGDVQVIIAACFADEADVTDPDTPPFVIYQPQTFTVTGAPEAPPAEPVPGDPSFTG
jgi:hypothetical protein